MNRRVRFGVAGAALGGAIMACETVEAQDVNAFNAASASHLRVDSSIGDLLRHKAFAGRGRLLLPWDDRRYDESMRLEDVGSLLPYHSHVDPSVVVASLNRLIDDAASGGTIFHDVYSASEKAADRTRENTGLFFFRGTPGAPFAVIAPGGGFAYVASVHEGFPYAAEISARGFNAFVLKYRAGQGGRVATEDLAAALRYIMRNARALGVGTADYSLWGSSAGARMVATIASHGSSGEGDAPLTQPAAVVMLYTGHADVGPTEPPTFVAVGSDDAIAPPATMERRVARLRRAGTEVEYQRYPGVGHGFGLGGGTSAEGWIDVAVRFWARHVDRADRFYRPSERPTPR